MTQESPLVLCYSCRTPLKEPPAQIKGEFYCRDCAEEELAKLRSENQ